MDSGEALVARAREVGVFLLQQCERLDLQKIIIYGSLARGTFDHLSDVDVMLIVSGDFKNADRVYDIILGELFEELEGKTPRADVHTCSEQSYYDENIPNSGTVFGDYLAAVKRDGIVIWGKIKFREGSFGFLPTWIWRIWRVRLKRVLGPLVDAACMRSR